VSPGNGHLFCASRGDFGEEGSHKCWGPVASGDGRANVPENVLAMRRGREWAMRKEREFRKEVKGLADRNRSWQAQRAFGKAQRAFGKARGHWGLGAGKQPPMAGNRQRLGRRLLAVFFGVQFPNDRRRRSPLPLSAGHHNWWPEGWMATVTRRRDEKLKELSNSLRLTGEWK
jgi:hypothetical protein